MPQNQPTEPAPVTQTPQTPAPPGATRSGTLLQKTTQILQRSWNQTQPVLRVQSIKALRGTIQVLEGAVKKLEAEPRQQPATVVVVDTAPEPSPILVDAAPDIPALQQPSLSPPIENPTTTPPVTDTPVNTPAAKRESTRKVPVSAAPTFVDKFLPSFDRVQNWRDAVLQKIRAILPPSVNQQLSDWGLTGAIALAVVFLLWTTVALLPGKPPDLAKIPATEIKTPPQLKAPLPPSPVKITPSPLAETQEPKLKAPLPPSPVKITPSPIAETPQQNLMASIQNRVADITTQYADSLIKSISANFEGSLLVVKVSDDWYNLSSSQQDKLADAMLGRAQELDFSKLKIEDSTGTLLARSPVVGSHMVIFDRS